MLLYLAAFVGLFYLVHWYRERQVVSHLQDKYVFITGCDSGLRVLAACLTEEGAEQLRKRTSARLETVILDVTQTESIAAAARGMEEHVRDR
uniref:17-beta-hydroxysteroid dehydrogenase type 6 n=1 Tax=Chinchilla lanigera TaxID=34839 RepID=A0A8C2VX86_CHILA